MRRFHIVLKLPKLRSCQPNELVGVLREFPRECTVDCVEEKYEEKRFHGSAETCSTMHFCYMPLFLFVLKNSSTVFHEA